MYLPFLLKATFFFFLEPLFSSRSRLQTYSLLHVFLLPTAMPPPACLLCLSFPLHSSSHYAHQIILATASKPKSCVCVPCSVVSSSLRPQGLWVPRQPTRLLCPWNSPDTNTGMGCHFLLQGSRGISPGPEI